MTLHTRVVWFAVGVLCTLAKPAMGQASINLEHMETLLRAGQATQVYETLVPAQLEWAGDPAFDYLLGLAALESGHPGLATLAFERLLAVDPRHGAARLDMGRAYFVQGDFVRARREFDLAQSLNPPPAAQAQMARYRAQMDAQLRAARTRVTAYLEAGAGSDSNVTQGPGNNSIYLPLFKVNFTLDAANQKKADDYSDFSAGAEWSRGLDAKRSVYMGLDARWRGYSKLSTSNYATAEWRGGMQWETGRDVWRLGASANDYRLLDQSYRSLNSVGVDLRRALSASSQALAFGQMAQVRYVPSAQVNNNVDQWLLGAGWVKQLAGPKSRLLSLSGFLGSEVEADRSRPRVDGDKLFVGLRAGAQVGLRSDLDLFATLSAQTAQYQRVNVLYERQRADQVYELAVGGVWRFAPAWTLKPQLSWMRNESNLAASDYDRYEASLMVRWSLK